MENLFVGTRYWGKTPQDLLRLKVFVESALPFAEAVLVAVNVSADETGVLGEAWPERVKVFPVTPWGKFVSPMNSLLLMSATLAGGLPSYFLSASVEVPLNPTAVGTMVSVLLERDGLVVGAALPGHDYSPGWQGQASGTQIPWNTCALWAPEMAALGFPIAGDAPWAPVLAGVEEATAIAVAQKIWGLARAQAILTQVPGVVWETKWDDLDRMEAHVRKMASKRERAAAQLKKLGVDPPFVVHI